jgi:hypothetical protein
MPPDRMRRLNFTTRHYHVLVLLYTLLLLLQSYFSRWGDSGVVDLKEEFSKLVALTAARTLLGREIREQLFDEVRPTRPN